MRAMTMSALSRSETPAPMLAAMAPLGSR